MGEDKQSGERVSVWAQVGDRIKFPEEKQAYTVQARGPRYLVCTKPFNARRTVLYTVIDLEEWVRGPENLIFGMGAETREQCEEMLARLEGRCEDGATEVSYRHRVPLVIERIIASRTQNGETPSPDCSVKSPKTLGTLDKNLSTRNEPT